MSGLMNGFYKFSIWTTRLAFLNFIWILFSILGIGIFGFFPSTIAMFSLIRKWIRGEHDISIMKTFWKYFKLDFIKANMLGYLVSIIGYLLFIELQILKTQEGLMYSIANALLITSCVMYLIILIYLFPIYVHFNLKFFQNIKWALVIGIVHPILTIALIFVVGILHYITFNVSPALLLFFGGSVTAFLFMWGAYQTFTKYEVNNSSQDSKNDKLN